MASPAGRRTALRLERHPIVVPDHFDAEVLSALGRMHRAGHLTADEVTRLLEDVTDAPFEREPTTPLLESAWALRHNVALQDALYVALAQALEAPLVTADHRLGRAAGELVEIELVD